MSLSFGFEFDTGEAVEGLSYHLKSVGVLWMDE